MVLARRLQTGHGGASFAAPTTFALTAVGQGGWNQQSDYKAVHYNGKTYIAWVATNGDVRIAAYTHATRSMGAAFTLHAALGVDVHISPSIVVRDSDKRILVFYCAHNAAAMYMRVSTNPEDVSAFAAEVNLDSQLGGSAYTYPSVFQQLGQAGDPIQLMYRDKPSDTKFCYSYSTDGGSTWSAQTVLLQETPQCYWKVYCDGDVRIDVVMSDGHPVTDAPTKLYHMYSDATNWRKSDGTIIAASPISPTDMTEVYAGGSGSGWVMNVVGGANPSCVYWRGTYGAGNMDVVHARWNGSSWVSTVIANEGKDATVIYAPGGAVLDEADPSIAWVTRWDGSQWELFKYTTPDNGATWSGEQITFGSTSAQLWPAVIRNRASGLSAIWLDGTITAEDAYSLAVRGTSR